MASEKNHKVLIPCGNSTVIGHFREWGYDLTNTLVDADLVCLTGGADINPALYKQMGHPRTWAKSTLRDQREVLVSRVAMNVGIPIVGICRGAQLLNVLLGGQLYQHVDGHHTDHDLLDAETGDVFTVSSLHHQMMIPLQPDGKVLAWAQESNTREWMQDRSVVREVRVHDWSDPEVVLYERNKALCFQPHPEFNGYEATGAYFQQLIIDNLL